MFKEIIDTNNNNLLKDFSWFKRVLYDNYDYNENEEEKSNNNNKVNDENNISYDESSVNTSCQSIEFNDEDENRFIPSNLLEQKINDKKENNSKSIHLLNPSCKPYIPKSKLSRTNNINNKNGYNNICNSFVNIYSFPFFLLFK